MHIRSLGVLSLLAASSFVARADTLIGSQVETQSLFPNTSTVDYSTGVQTVTPGLTDSIPGLEVDVTFNANTIIITNEDNAAFNGSVAFEGFLISFLPGVTLKNVSIDPSSTPEFSGNLSLSFTGSDIMFNLKNECNGNSSNCAIGDQIVLDVSDTMTTLTPEPSSIALLGTGLLGVASVVRKRFA